MHGAPVEVGEILVGKYRVERVLGVGGMGVVVAARHLHLDEMVALKFMLPAVLGNPEAVARFLREARAAVKLKGEHVARVLDVGTLENGAPYIVMEYLDGRDLSAVLEHRGALPVTEAVTYVLQACMAMAEAHAQGIVHRDLKPQNLFLTTRPDGSPFVKVLDFGISKAAASEGFQATQTTAVMGSPSYMSPEQMRSAKDVDARTDVWALGVILYQLVTARLPFHADTMPELVLKVSLEEPDPLQAYLPSVPPTLQAIIGWCLKKNRTDRCANVVDLVAGLAPLAPDGPETLASVTKVMRIAPSHAAAALGGTPSRPGMKPLSETVVAPPRSGMLTPPTGVAVQTGRQLGQGAISATTGPGERAQTGGGLAPKFDSQTGRPLAMNPTVAPDLRPNTTLSSSVGQVPAGAYTGEDEAPRGKGKLFAIGGIAVAAAAGLAFFVLHGGGKSAGSGSAAQPTAPAAVPATTTTPTPAPTAPGAPAVVPSAPAVTSPNPTGTPTDPATSPATTPPPTNPAVVPATTPPVGPKTHTPGTTHGKPNKPAPVPTPDPHHPAPTGPTPTGPAPTPPVLTPSPPPPTVTPAPEPQKAPPPKVEPKPEPPKQPDPATPDKTKIENPFRTRH